MQLQPIRNTTLVLDCAGRHRLALIALLFSMIGCNVPRTGDAPGLTALPERKEAEALSPGAGPATAAPPSPSLVPSPAILPTGEPGAFHNLVFSAERYGSGESHFPTGIEEIYARWDYAGMREGMVVRREWMVNGSLWVAREETWDYPRYGSQGTIYDISIFDRIEGLPGGEWTLNLYVNGAATPALAGSFTVGDLRERETPSPDGSRLAWIANWRGLTVDGMTIFEAEFRLGGLSWFPDNRHIAVSETIPESANARPGPPGPRYRLWRVDSSSGEVALIGDEDAFLHSPVVSPDGRWLAAMHGNGFGDACFSGLGLAFLPLSTDLVPGEPVSLFGFAGLEAYLYEDVYPVNGPDFERPGYWENPETFIAALAFTCGPEDSDGIFRIQVDERRAERLGPLEE